MDKLIYILFSLLLFINCSKTGGSARKTDSIDPQKLDVYLLIGQSNMSGRAEIEEQDRDTLKNVFLFTGIPGNEWEKAANPLNKYSTVRKKLSMQKLGPGYTFARKISESFHDRQIGLVVNARGGTSVDLWKPGAKLYEEALARAKEAMKSGNMKGILWFQGSSDLGNLENYMEKLEFVIQSLRKELNSPDLPFIAGELPHSDSERVAFNQMLKHLPENVSNTKVVVADGLETFDNGVHFNSAGQRIFGERYARAILYFNQ